MRSLDQKKFSRLRNTLSQSVVLDDLKPLKAEMSLTNTLMQTDTKQSLLDKSKEAMNTKTSRNQSKMLLSIDEDIRASSIMLFPL